MKEDNYGQLFLSVFLLRLGLSILNLPFYRNCLLDCLTILNMGFADKVNKTTKKLERFFMANIQRIYL